MQCLGKMSNTAGANICNQRFVLAKVRAVDLTNSAVQSLVPFLCTDVGTNDVRVEAIDWRSVLNNLIGFFQQYHIQLQWKSATIFHTVFMGLFNSPVLCVNQILNQIYTY